MSLLPAWKAVPRTLHDSTAGSENYALQHVLQKPTNTVHLDAPFDGSSRLKGHFATVHEMPTHALVVKTVSAKPASAWESRGTVSLLQSALLCGHSSCLSL